MKVQLVAIGNSKGVRLPASVIKECRLGDELDLRVENGAVILSRARRPREGWDAAFAKAGEDEADAMIETPTPGFDETEWTW